MTKKICFVIQPFSDPYDKRFENVYKPAIENAGLIPYRTGGHSVDDIPEDIRQRICEAYICFADITEDRPNVWYEVGFAHACGKQVVMVCDEEERPSKNLPFDISVRNVLFYEGKQVDSKKFYRDGVIKDIVERVKARERVKTRAEEADSDITASPVTIQQPKSSDNSLTPLDIQVLEVICGYDLKTDNSIHRDRIISVFSDFDEEKILLSLGEIEEMEYITKMVNYVGSIYSGDKTETVYYPTEKGRKWYRDRNRD